MDHTLSWGSIPISCHIFLASDLVCGNGWQGRHVVLTLALLPGVGKQPSLVAGQRGGGGRNRFSSSSCVLEWQKWKEKATRRARLGAQMTASVAVGTPHHTHTHTSWVCVWGLWSRQGPLHRKCSTSCHLSLLGNETSTLRPPCVNSANPRNGMNQHGPGCLQG